MILFTFLLATGAFLFQSICLFDLPINAYIPWISLVILGHRLEKKDGKALGLSALAGVAMDLLSDHPFGLHPISYALTAFFLFRFRNRFLSEKPLHLALFTILASLTASLSHLFFLFLFDRKVEGDWRMADWVGRALFDGLYSMIWFSGPLALWAKIRQIWPRLQLVMKR